jgi:hypothetical protein
MLLGVVGSDPLLPTAGGIAVEIDWDKAGFGTYGDNVTSRVRPLAQALSVEYGRDQSTALSPTVAGRGSFTLDNRSRDYSPRNTASILYGKIKPARPVRITRTIGSAVFGLFAGHTDNAPINPDLDSQTVSLTLLDYLADFRGQTISTPLHRDIRTGQAVGYILDACGWPANLRDLDVGATIIPWWYEDGTDALEALEKVVRSEGPPALLTMGATGNIVFRDRHHRLTQINSLTSQSTWRAGGPVEPVMTKSFVYDEAWGNIINSGTASVDVRTQGELQPVWTSDATVTLSAGEQKVITAAASDPFLGAVTPVAGTDYKLMSGTVTTQLIRTSGVSTGIVLTAGSGGAVLTNLQIRARPIPVAYTMQVSASDSQSISDYGPRSYPGDLPWCGVGDAQAILDLTVAIRSQPLPVVSARFVVGSEPAKASQLLGRDLSDLVTVVEPETATDGTFYVEAIKHDLTGVFDHSVTFGLESSYVEAGPVARCDTAGTGCDVGKLSRGVDDPTLVAICDTSGHGLNQAIVAH